MRHLKLAAMLLLSLSASVSTEAKTSLTGLLTDGVKSAIEDKFDRSNSPPAKTMKFDQAATYTLCFVPDGPSCEQLLINMIDNTRSSLFIQAYSFTSAPIAKAVVAAKKRGVDVEVIVDKSQNSERYTVVTTLTNAGIPVFVDTKPAIAHNKVMIFDQTSVFTGSFNFTASAQKRNAENGIVITGDPSIVKSYSSNWLARYQQSTKI